MNLIFKNIIYYIPQTYLRILPFFGNSVLKTIKPFSKDQRAGNCLAPPTKRFSNFLYEW